MLVTEIGKERCNVFIKKKLLILLCVAILLTASGVAFSAEWEMVARTYGGDTFFVDKSFVEVINLTKFKIIKTQIKRVLGTDSKRLIEKLFKAIANANREPWPDEASYTTEDGTEYTIRLLDDYDVEYTILKVYLNSENYGYIATEERYYSPQRKEIGKAKFSVPSTINEDSFTYVSPYSAIGATIDYCMEYLKRKHKL